MVKGKGQVDESILVCVYYGPNGERLIKKGHKLAKVLDCPLYVLTVDPLPYDEFDADKSGYVERWEELADELDVEEFIMRDNEKQPITRAIAEVADTFHVTQVVIGQTPQNRWEEITKGSFVNALQRELSPLQIYISYPLTGELKMKKVKCMSEEYVHSYSRMKRVMNSSFHVQSIISMKGFFIKKLEQTLTMECLSLYVKEKPLKYMSQIIM